VAGERHTNPILGTCREKSVINMIWLLLHILIGSHFVMIALGGFLLLVVSHLFVIEFQFYEWGLPKSKITKTWMWKMIVKGSHTEHSWRCSRDIKHSQDVLQLTSWSPVHFPVKIVFGHVLGQLDVITMSIWHEWRTKGKPSELELLSIPDHLEYSLPNYEYENVLWLYLCYLDVLLVMWCMVL
jgi:hypothetical protein